jgi:hypothetical protein
MKTWVSTSTYGSKAQLRGFDGVDGAIPAIGQDGQWVREVLAAVLQRQLG